MERCWVEVHLNELESNLQKIRAMVPQSVRIISVVKADAYGHGIQATVTRLMQSGTDMFAVANTQEAISIRELGAGWPILILSPLLPDEYDICLKYDLIPTLSSLNEAQLLDQKAKALKISCPIHFKVDTGMGRVGSWHDDANEVFNEVNALPNISIQGIYTHFATSDSDLEFTQVQRERFVQFLDKISYDPNKCIIHADNSAGLESFDHTRNGIYNAVRVGLIQFGAQAREHSLLNAFQPKPVLSFHTRIGLIKTIPSNTAVSYNRTYTTSKETKIAILTAGYGDGVPLSYSNRGHVLINEKLCPIIGRVTMDQCIVDISHIENCQVADIATLIGRQGNKEITLEDFAKDAVSIPWEVLCSITQRVNRIYKTIRQ